MTEKEFKTQIIQLLMLYRKRMRRLQAIARGDATVKRVKVKGHWVRKHYVHPYTRFL